MDRFLASYADDSALKRGILEAGDEPAAVLRRFAAAAAAAATAAAPADPAGPRPQDAALDAAPGRTDAFQQSVRIRQLLSRRYATEDRTGQSFMQYMAGLIRQRLEPEMERPQEAVAGAGAGADVLSAVLRGVGGDDNNTKPSALPHAGGALSEERRALAEQRGGLRDRQRAARRRALLAQLSPVQQIQILEDTVDAQLEGLLSIDFMELFLRSKTVLFVVGANQGEGFMQKLGIRGGTQSSALDQLVNVPLLLGESLVGDSSKDEKLLWSMVEDVKNIISKSVDDLLDGRYEGEKKEDTAGDE